MDSPGGKTMKIRVFLSLILLAVLGSCGGDGPGVSKSVDPVLIKVAYDPSDLTFVTGSGPQPVDGYFVFIALSADLNTGWLLAGQCGAEPGEPLEVPFTGIDGTFYGNVLVQFALDADCPPGEYTAAFYVTDLDGRKSKPEEILYEIIPDA
jgi:hypothetical protein